MSVWHVITSEYPPQVGGVSDHTRRLAEALVRSGDDVHVWCPAGERRESAGVHVHPDLGRFRPSDWRRAGRALDAFPGPRRLFLQWVPHGFGYRSMNLWCCLWLASRALAGDRVEVMVHEPFMELRRGPTRHVVMALVHRVMAVILLAIAWRVWVAIPAWESRLRPFALGRRVRMAWLPVPACLPAAGPPDSGVEARRRAGRTTLGHFGTYGDGVAELLERRLVPLMARSPRPLLLLLGRGGDRFRARLVERYPAWAPSVVAPGYLAETELPRLFAMVDLFLQPYPDGVSTRRTSVMACLASGRPVLTTSGHLTETLWTDSRAVALVDVADEAAHTSSAMDLLDRRSERDRLGREGLSFYRRRFDIDRLLATLRAAEFDGDGREAPCASPF